MWLVDEDLVSRKRLSVGSDIEQIKAMGTDHIIFGHLFSSVGRNMKMVKVTMQLAKFAK